MPIGKYKEHGSATSFDNILLKDDRRGALFAFGTVTLRHLFEKLLETQATVCILCTASLHVTCIGRPVCGSLSVEDSIIFVLAAKLSNTSKCGQK